MIMLYLLTFETYIHMVLGERRVDDYCNLQLFTKGRKAYVIILTFSVYEEVISVV